MARYREEDILYYQQLARLCRAELHSLVFIAAILSTGLPVSAGPILSISGPPVNNPTGIFPTNVLAVQFTLGQAYSNVSVAADLVGSFAGQVFVTNQIGLGTSLTNELATGSFSSTGGPFGTLQMILQGVNFPGAGAYYLVFSTNQSTPPQGLEETNSPTTVSDPGAALGMFFFGSGAGFPPNENFSLINGGGGAYAPEFSLTSAAPEPATWIIGVVFAVFLYVQRMRTHRRGWALSGHITAAGKGCSRTTAAGQQRTPCLPDFADSAMIQR